jgi:hypothetical protein
MMTQHRLHHHRGQDRHRGVGQASGFHRQPPEGLDLTALAARIKIAHRRAGSQERALVFLCTPLAYFLVAGERSAGIENSCPTLVWFVLDIDGYSIARRKCLFERFVE